MIKFASSMLLGVMLCGCSIVPGSTANKLSKAESRVRYELADGDTAKFRNVKVNDTYVCGEVNAKNAFGAYAGYTPFVDEGGVITIANPNLADRSVPSLMTWQTVADRCREVWQA
jgi:hypothetical protein